MPKGREIVYLGNDNTVRRQILEQGIVPVSDPVTITKVVIVLVKGSDRYSLNSTDNPVQVKLPDVDWIVELALGDQSIVEGDYSATLVLFDAINDDGIIIQKFPMRITSV